jgi:hypothetical protein
MAAFSCAFFSFASTRGTPWIGLVPPFDSTIAADLGLFRYRITDSTNEAEERSFVCTRYDEFFRDFKDASQLWIVAQFCQVFAVVLGGMGWMFCVIETTCRHASCPFLLLSVLIFGAFVLQGCTFLIFLETEFWYVPFLSI